MNILIVDDDRYVIEALRKSINWNELGFSNVLTAMNMNEAIQIIETEQIDLLVDLYLKLTQDLRVKLTHL